MWADGSDVLKLLSSVMITKCSTASSRGATGLQDWRQVRVHQHHLVARVIDDVHQVLGRQPDVGGVGYRPHRRRRKIRLQVPVRIPSESAHPVALANPKTCECIAKPVHSLLEFPVGVAVDSVPLTGDDLLVGENKSRPGPAVPAPAAGSSSWRFASVSGYREG